MNADPKLESEKEVVDMDEVQQNADESVDETEEVADDDTVNEDEESDEDDSLSDDEETVSE